MSGLQNTLLALSAEEAAQIGAAGMLAGSMMMVAIIGSVWYILKIIAWWKIFEKAGEGGWKALIPFYNYYTQLKISWDASIFWVIIGLGIATTVLSAVASDEGSMLSVVAGVCSLAVCVLSIMATAKLSSAFGHGIGFTIGLIFLNPIFVLILGLGESRYIGANGGMAQMM
ncbi:MAG: hypothetical protein IJV04_08420 [Lachnospiraceae bacterium]|nr:hypothetical protein [Lachnospiraceae bacterium]